MTRKHIVVAVAWPVLVLGLTLLAPARVLAHCDGLDGPVGSRKGRT